MGVLGIGVDVCDIARFEAACRRTPAMVGRLFTGSEVTMSVESQAARFAAKEALAKALGVPKGMDWHDCEVVSEPSGRPVFALRGSVAAAVDHLGARSVHLSLSHDGGLATAFVVLSA